MSARGGVGCGVVDWVGIGVGQVVGECAVIRMTGSNIVWMFWMVQS